MGWVLLIVVFVLSVSFSFVGLMYPTFINPSFRKQQGPSGPQGPRSMYEGVLPLMQGGTNSSDPLTNGFFAQSDTNSIKESSVSFMLPEFESITTRNGFSIGISPFNLMLESQSNSNQTVTLLNDFTGDANFILTDSKSTQPIDGDVVFTASSIEFGADEETRVKLFFENEAKQDRTVTIPQNDRKSTSLLLTNSFSAQNVKTPVDFIGTLGLGTVAGDVNFPDGATMTTIAGDQVTFDGKTTLPSIIVNEIFNVTDFKTESVLNTGTFSSSGLMQAISFTGTILSANEVKSGTLTVDGNVDCDGLMKTNGTTFINTSTLATQTGSVGGTLNASSTITCSAVDGSGNFDVKSGNVTIAGTLNASNFSGSNSGDVTVTSFGSSPNSNGLSLSGQVLRLQPASSTFPGAISTVAQSFAGVKTFSGNLFPDSAGTALEIPNGGVGVGGSIFASSISVTDNATFSRNVSVGSPSFTPSGLKIVNTVISPIIQKPLNVYYEQSFTLNFSGAATLSNVPFICSRFGKSVTITCGVTPFQSIANSANLLSTSNLPSIFIPKGIGGSGTPYLGFYISGVSGNFSGGNRILPVRIYTDSAGVSQGLIEIFGSIVYGPFQGPTVGIRPWSASYFASDFDV